MSTIFINSLKAQAESEALQHAMELSIQLLSTIRKEGLTIYQYRPSVNFEKADGADSAKVKFSYAYKYHHISVGNYPVFTSTQNDTSEGIETAIKEIIDQVQLYQQTQTQLGI